MTDEYYDPDLEVLDENFVASLQEPRFIVTLDRLDEAYKLGYQLYCDDGWGDGYQPRNDNDSDIANNEHFSYRLVKQDDMVGVAHVWRERQREHEYPQGIIDNYDDYIEYCSSNELLAEHRTDYCNNLGANALEQIGVTLYGSNWKGALADCLGVRRQSIQQWIKTKSIIPMRVWDKLAELIESKKTELEQASDILSQVTD